MSTMMHQKINRIPALTTFDFQKFSQTFFKNVFQLFLCQLKDAVAYPDKSRHG